MSLQHFLPKQKDKLARVLPARVFIEEQKRGSRSPFLRESRVTKLKRGISVFILNVCEYLLGQSFLVENASGELAGYSASNRRLLERLIKSGTVTKWDAGQRAVDKPGIPYVALTVGAVKNRHDATLIKAGLQGQGTGKTLDEAMTVALAETLERIAISEYNLEQLSLHSIEELSMQKIPFFFHSYIYADVNHSMRTNWVKARDLVTGRKVLLPASMAYMSYAALNPLEPVFTPSTSNGCATYTDKTNATLKAVYESLERDGFLMYWLNRLAPRKITLDGYDDGESLAEIALLQKHGIDLHFLDCHTEYGIPVLVSVLIDNKTGGVDINAAAGFDTDELFRKVIRDSMRWGVGYAKKGRGNIDPQHMTSLDDRGRLWRGGSMRREIDFFLAGEVVSYHEYRQKPDFVGPDKALNRVISVFQDRRESLYALDLTNELARNAGLYVARVIAPSLIPMYFDEARKPLNVERLYSFPRLMGCAKEDNSREALNTVPHPFI